MYLLYSIDLVIKVAWYRGDPHDNHCSSGCGIHTHKSLRVGNGLHTSLVVGATILCTLGVANVCVLTAMSFVIRGTFTGEGTFRVRASSTKLAGT